MDLSAQLRRAEGKPPRAGHAKYGMIGSDDARAAPEARGLARRLAARAEERSRPPCRTRWAMRSTWRSVGEKHVSAKPLKGLGSGVLEVVSDHRGDTFRSVYTVRFADRVFVLHAFQKKSKSGIATPKADIELIKQRLKQAVEIGKKKE